MYKDPTMTKTKKIQELIKSTIVPYLANNIGYLSGGFIAYKLNINTLIIGPFFLKILGAYFGAKIS